MHYKELHWCDLLSDQYLYLFVCVRAYVCEEVHLEKHSNKHSIQATPLQMLEESDDLVDDGHSWTSQVSDQGSQVNLVRRCLLAPGSQTLDLLRVKTQVVDWTEVSV